MAVRAKTGLSCTGSDPARGASPERPRHGPRRLSSPSTSSACRSRRRRPSPTPASLAGRLERGPLHLLRRRPGRALRAGAALRALVPARRAAPPAAPRPREEAPARPPRARGLLVRAGRGDRPLLAGGLPLRGGGLGRGRLEGARAAAERRLRRQRDGARGRGRARGEPARAHSPGSTGCAATRTSTRCGAWRRRPCSAPAATARRARPSRAGPRSSRSTRRSSGAVGCTEAQLPYTTIVALDEKGATLHYESKRTARGGRVLLLDAGAQARRYACDITRTTPAPGGDARFAELVQRVDALEQELAAAATPGRALPGGPPRRPPRRGADPVRPRARAGLRRGGLREGLHPPLLPSRHRPPPRHPGARRGRAPGRPLGHPGAAAEGAPVPAQHAHHRARPRLHDRARDLLHPDAAAALPLRARSPRPSTGRRSTRSPRSAACGSRTTWW